MVMKRRGFSLIEVMISLFILVLGLMTISYVMSSVTARLVRNTNEFRTEVIFRSMDDFPITQELVLGWNVLPSMLWNGYSVGRAAYLYEDNSKEIITWTWNRPGVEETSIVNLSSYSPSSGDILVSCSGNIFYIDNEMPSANEFELTNPFLLIKSRIILVKSKRE
jgi:prepilin-type N-terminal cleavage/methylation domain-containing protein